MNDGPSLEGLGGGPSEAAKLAVGVAAEMEAGDGFLAGVAALGVGYAADLVVAHLLGESAVVDLYAQSRPAGEEAGGVEVAFVTWESAGLGQALDHRFDRRREPYRDGHEGRRFGRQCHGDRAQVAAHRYHSPSGLGRSHAGFRQHLEAVAAEEPGYSGFAAEIGGAGEPGWELASEEVRGRGASRAWHDERQRVALPENPRVHHDHALGREQRAVHQA